ncbi:sugar transferase [Rubneribacter badeniensis]|uniref:sugar transferase n=1 Tax=Rubneribacter badeniensis TaxID=2070688 RepID=UPI003A8D9FF1
MSEVEARGTIEYGEIGMVEPGTEEFAELCRSLDCRSLPYRFVKRLFDIVFSACVIVAGFAPCLLLALAIVVDTKGSPIYSQIRVGKYGRPFRVWKFRSMVADSDDVEKHLSKEQLAQWNAERKVDDDPRVTKLGRVIRRLSLDELPNLLNVFCGELSVIGPRAITYDELGHYGSQAAELLSVPQGVTGLWQVGDRNSATFENGMRQAIELEYVKRASLRTDVAIFFDTFGAMFVRRTGK